MRVEFPTHSPGRWRIDGGAVAAVIPDEGKPALLVVRWCSLGSWHEVELTPADLALVETSRGLIARALATIKDGQS